MKNIIFLKVFAIIMCLLTSGCFTASPTMIVCPKDALLVGNIAFQVASIVVVDLIARYFYANAFYSK